MKINHKILENGDLKFSVEFDNEEERLESIACTDTRAGYDWFWEELTSDSDFEIMTDDEKIHCGDLYGGDIITNIDEEIFKESDAETIESRTWFYRYYATQTYVERLFKKGNVVLTCRKNLEQMKMNKK